MYPGRILHSSQLELPRRARDAALSAGFLERVAHGWYATQGADPDIVRAIRVGGRITCLSAAGHHGLWVPENRQLHVALRPCDRLPRVSGVVFHRLETEGWGTGQPIMGLAVVIDHVLRHHSIEDGLAVLESAVERGLAGVEDAHALIAAQTARKRTTGLQHFDARSGSGSETRVRLWFQRRNVRVRTQAQIVGVGRVDLLVGESLVIEVDSVAHHASVEQYEEDRRRDLVLTALSFQVVRLTWAQVFLTWPETVAALRGLLATGRHREPPSPDAYVYLPELRRAS